MSSPLWSSISARNIHQVRHFPRVFLCFGTSGHYPRTTEKSSWTYKKLTLVFLIIESSLVCQNITAVDQTVLQMSLLFQRRTEPGAPRKSFWQVAPVFSYFFAECLWKCAAFLPKIKHCAALFAALRANRIERKPFLYHFSAKNFKVRRCVPPPPPSSRSTRRCALRHQKLPPRRQPRDIRIHRALRRPSVSATVSAEPTQLRY